MFCSNCGKEVEKQWVKCPYCGENLKSEGQNADGKNKGNVETEQQKKEFTDNSAVLKKKKTLLPVIGVVIVVAVLVMMLFAGRGTRSNVSDLSSYEGGYAGWEASGFEGSVRTDIAIPYPIVDTEKNNYAVYIGTGKTNVGVIMQENEAAISEWEWLMNAQPDSTTQEYYFSCVLTYTGHDVEDYGYPIFVIKDVEVNNQITDNAESADSKSGIDMAQYVAGNIDNLLQADRSYHMDEDGFFYNDATGTVTISVTDNMIDMLVIGENNAGNVKFAGVGVGDSMQSVSNGNLESAGYTYCMQDERGVLYMNADGMSGVMFEVDDNNCVKTISWMDNMNEMLGASVQSSTDYTSVDQTDAYSESGDSEVIQWFAGDYVNENGMISILQDLAGTYTDSGLEISGQVIVAMNGVTTEALLIEDGTNVYRMYQETGNAFIGDLYLTEYNVTISGSNMFDGIYELEYLYERDEP